MTHGGSQLPILFLRAALIIEVQLHKENIRGNENFTEQMLDRRLILPEKPSPLGIECTFDPPAPYERIPVHVMVQPGGNE